MPPDSLLIVSGPKPQDHDVTMWVDEQIWGHRLWDGQSPWLLFLEFLTVAEACHREGRLLDEQGRFYPLRFKPYKRSFLRNILFHNEQLFSIADTYADNHTAWTQWLKWMEDNAKFVPVRDFSYLRNRFHSFHDFAKLVGMLQTSAIESESNKRWSSRFVFPFGPNGIYDDLNPKGTTEHVYFGRTGHLLYMMLCRTEYSPELRPYIESLFTTRNKWDTLLCLLQPQDDDTTERKNSYLPYQKHTSFDNLAEDWLSIFRLQLPIFDAFPHLVTLGAFHMLLYQLNIAEQWCRTNQRPTLVCEVVAPKKTLVREQSIESYQTNNALPARAIETLIKDIESFEEWQVALSSPEAFVKCSAILRERVWWPNAEKDYGGASNPDSLLAELRSEALKRHKGHVAQVHQKYGNAVGLISRRSTNVLRYAPTDNFLKTLILANVTQRLEFGEFLSRLYDRYGFVFGDREAQAALPATGYDKEAFQSNARRLEQRLSSLGMLRRLSDACAYVENPYSGRIS